MHTLRTVSSLMSALERKCSDTRDRSQRAALFCYCPRHTSESLWKAWRAAIVVQTYTATNITHTQPRMTDGDDPGEVLKSEADVKRVKEEGYGARGHGRREDENKEVVKKDAVQSTWWETSCFPVLFSRLCELDWEEHPALPEHCWLESICGVLPPAAHGRWHQREMPPLSPSSTAAAAPGVVTTAQSARLGEQPLPPPPPHRSIHLQSAGANSFFNSHLSTILIPVTLTLWKLPRNADIRLQTFSGCCISHLHCLPYRFEVHHIYALQVFLCNQKQSNFSIKKQSQHFFSTASCWYAWILRNLQAASHYPYTLMHFCRWCCSQQGAAPRQGCCIHSCLLGSSNMQAVV